MSNAAKKMILIIGALSLLLAAGGAIYYRSLVGAAQFALGVALSAALNMAKVYLLERTVRKSVDIGDPDAGKRYAQLQYLSRYMLTGLVLAVAALAPFVDLWGAIIGIFVWQAAIVAMRLMKIDQ